MNARSEDRLRPLTNAPAAFFKTLAATSGPETYMAITFTAEEKNELAKAITKAACGIAECWDILSQIGDRIGRDWEPEGTSVADIAEHNASDLENPAAIECLDADSVAEYFGDDENWKNPVR